VVDFRLIFFVSETTFMATAATRIQSFSDLNGKRIGCTAGTTNLWAVSECVAQGRFTPRSAVVTESHSEGIQALEKGLIDPLGTSGKTSRL
jgi:ABC-type amino acid transport substrate-binding protein